MYYAHPKDTDTFVADDFIKENQETLQRLRKESEYIFPGSFRNQKIVEQRATLMTVAVWHDFESLMDIPQDFEPDEKTQQTHDALMSVYNALSIWMTLEAMADEGSVKRVDGKYRNSAFSEGVQKRRKKILGKRGL